MFDKGVLSNREVVAELELIAVIIYLSQIVKI